ncbi:PREDICTED: uncharacterized protein At3g49140-like isoform X1 [Nicotiana attenuata]|uniref:Pentatricopeptide repeat-containing protein n=1 Tax=Nicotiana attenuata TaxID=49451 RepID=A0A1J6KVC3_NICAT|nr:PREDICTED: uncharacterized protein At3g49140-like isoform X1 [Nicotiana attenuata]OIT26707.1 uncharacterized protein A4A49_24332 [Nicotiana attenuata]
MLMVEPAVAAVRFSAGNFNSTYRRFSHSASFSIPRNKFRRLATEHGGGRIRTGKGKCGIKASTKDQSSAGTGPVKQNAKPSRYHPFEDISDSEIGENEEAQLTPAETSKTIIEVNSKATLMFSGVVNNEVHENIFWPDLPYITDELGNIYFQVKNDEDILQTLTAEENVVQVIIGLDTAEMLSELESFGQSEVDYGIDEFDDEDSDIDDEDDLDEDDDDDGDEDESDYDKDWVAILDDEDQDGDSDGSLGDWAKLETMRSSHPMYFAKKIAEVVTDDPIDFMDQPPAGLAIQGVLRPSFLEEHTTIQKQISEHRLSDADLNQMEKDEDHKEKGGIQINGHKHESGSSQDSPSWAELEKDENLGNGTSFYKLEMIKIQLISSSGNQIFVELDDFRRARPDAIAHSAAKIISRLKAAGERTTQALRSLCWRCKGIQVEEVSLIGVDSLGFDLRVCSGTQVQTLRFSFRKRASSEYSAERQLNDLLFPRIHHKLRQKKESHQAES